MARFQDAPAPNYFSTEEGAVSNYSPRPSLCRRAFTSIVLNLVVWLIAVTAEADSCLLSSISVEEKNDPKYKTCDRKYAVETRGIELPSTVSERIESARASQKVLVDRWTTSGEALPDEALGTLVQKHFKNIRILDDTLDSKMPAHAAPEMIRDVCEAHKKRERAAVWRDKIVAMAEACKPPIEDTND